MALQIQQRSFSLQASALIQFWNLSLKKMISLCKFGGLYHLQRSFFFGLTLNCFNLKWRSKQGDAIEGARQVLVLATLFFLPVATTVALSITKCNVSCERQRKSKVYFGRFLCWPLPSWQWQPEYSHTDPIYYGLIWNSSEWNHVWSSVASRKKTALFSCLPTEKRLPE